MLGEIFNEKDKKTKQETINYLKMLSYKFKVDAHRNNDPIAEAKSEAYELAVFEIERNME